MTSFSSSTLSVEQQEAMGGVGWQQSTSESKPSETGQLINPQARPSWHSSWESQSPSFSEQVLQ